MRYTINIITGGTVQSDWFSPHSIRLICQSLDALTWYIYHYVPENAKHKIPLCHTRSDKLCLFNILRILTF